MASKTEFHQCQRKPTQAEQDEHHATGRAACRSRSEHCVGSRARVSHVIALKESCLKLESTTPAWDQKEPR